MATTATGRITVAAARSGVVRSKAPGSSSGERMIRNTRLFFLHRRTLSVLVVTEENRSSYKPNDPAQGLINKDASTIIRPTAATTTMRSFFLPADDPGDDNKKSGASSKPVKSTNVVPFLLADIGEGIQEVEVLQWYVQVGDQVREFDTLCQVQSDKATVEITSRFAGKIVSLSETAMVKVGQPLVHIETEAAATGSETDLASSEATSELEKEQQQQQQDDDEQSGADGSRLQVPSEASSRFTLNSDDETEAGRMTPSSKYLASPAVRKLAAEHGINVPRDIVATGPNGRVLKADILKFLAKDQPPETAAAQAPTSRNFVDQTEQQQKKVVSMTGYNRFMVQSMTESLQIPHMGLGDEIVVDKLIRFRREWNEEQQEADRLGMQPLLIKACSLALREHPAVNAKVHNVQQCQVSVHEHHDIGIAMDTPHGLVVPVIRHVQTLSLLEIQAELQRLKAAAATGTTALADLTPSPTFTLSNIGAVGVGTHMSPVLVPPLICMGALGRIQRLPRFVNDADDEVVATHVLYVSWVADHRFLDGASLARFHKSFAKYASNPMLMLPYLT